MVKLTQDTKSGYPESDLLKRSPNNYGEFEARVDAIIQEVRAHGDEALFSCTEKFDGAKMDGRYDPAVIRRRDRGGI